MPTTSSTSSNSARITACSKSKSPANGWAKTSSKPMCARNKASTSLPSKRATLPSSSPQATTSSAKTTTSSSPAPSKTSTASNTELSSQKTFRNHRLTRWFRFFYIWQRTPLSSPSRITPRRKTPAPPCYHFYMRRHSAAAFRKLHLLFVFRNTLKKPLLTMGDFCPTHNIIIKINVSSRN